MLSLPAHNDHSTTNHPGDCRGLNYVTPSGVKTIVGHRPTYVLITPNPRPILDVISTLGRNPTQPL
jgi:hypothetical protein